LVEGSRRDVLPDTDLHPPASARAFAVPLSALIRAKPQPFHFPFAMQRLAAWRVDARGRRVRVHATHRFRSIQFRTSRSSK
jgi:hypothetical protein